VAGELVVRLATADGDPPLAEALDRWELSLFQHDPFRSEQLRGAFAALLDDTWPLRAAVLLEQDPEARARLHDELAGLADGADASPAAADAARRTLVEVLRDGDRAGLARGLDRELLGVEGRRGLRVAV
jgi:hypothetical protein